MTYEIDIERKSIEALLALIEKQAAPIGFDLTVARDALRGALDPELDADLWGDNDD